MRVSTEDQENKNQELRLQEVAQSHGWDNVEVFQDKESGGKRSRPGPSPGGGIPLACCGPRPVIPFMLMERRPGTLIRPYPPGISILS